jgi:hypothetical protein
VEFSTITDTLAGTGRTVGGVGGVDEVDGLGQADVDDDEDDDWGVLPSLRCSTRNHTSAVSSDSAPMKASAGSGRRRSGAVIGRSSAKCLPGC